MSLAKRATLFVTLLLILFVSLFSAGQYSRTSLSNALEYITGPAWDAADGSMETAILVEREMLLMHELYTAQELNTRQMDDIRREASDAFGRMVASGLLEANSVSALESGLNAFYQAGDDVRSAFAAFTTERARMNANAERLVTLSEQIEEAGDQEMEALENEPDRLLSWADGIAGRWMAADGGMEATIGFYRQLHVLERMINDGVSPALETQMEEATGFLNNGRASLIASQRLNGPAPQGFSGGTISSAYSQLVDAHNLQLSKTIAHLRDMQQALTGFNNASAHLLETLQTVEAQADAKVEGETANLDHVRTTTGTIMVSMLALCLALLAAATWYIRHRVLGSLRELASTLREIADGDGDLSRRVDGRQQDELGTIGRSFNRFVEKITQIVRSVDRNASDLGGGIQSCVSLSASLSRETASTATVSNAIMEALAQVEGGADNIASGCIRVADETHKTETLASSGQQQMRQMISANQKLTTDLQSACQQVVSLQDQVNGINQLLGVISDISEQTNLLALNAAIEAARAGEQGRGFAVVADEVRNLANRSAESSRQIANVIGQIVEGTNEAADKMSESSRRADEGSGISQQAGETLSQIVRHMKTINGEIHMVASAAEEQSSTLKAVSADMQNMVATARQCHDEAAEVEQVNQRLDSLKHALESTMRQFRLPDRHL
ncbi:methyl-accepting chemotaxis protein [Thalassolituus sp. LLYu03]|uniref:methyl-accepting chemotaxis protein n=1 Tax=Thalassolituus sp. LLYu03 TaxID=3421656 RepID=UPI003D2E0FE3